MAAQVARVLGHMTIVGLGSAPVPVNFSGPAKECRSPSPYWGYIPELMEVVSLAQAGKIKMLVEHFPLERAGRSLPPSSRRKDQGTCGHGTEWLDGLRKVQREGRSGHRAHGVHSLANAQEIGNCSCPV